MPLPDYNRTKAFEISGNLVTVNKRYIFFKQRIVLCAFIRGQNAATAARNGWPKMTTKHKILHPQKQNESTEQEFTVQCIYS